MLLWRWRGAPRCERKCEQGAWGGMENERLESIQKHYEGYDCVSANCRHRLGEEYREPVRLPALDLEVVAVVCRDCGLVKLHAVEGST